MIAKDSQKPPYEESAVAPKVFPTAISLPTRQYCRCISEAGSPHGSIDIPHAGEQLHQAAITEGNADDKIGLAQASGAHIDQAQHERRQGEC